jgi:hypothetical protein
MQRRMQCVTHGTHAGVKRAPPPHLCRIGAQSVECRKGNLALLLQTAWSLEHVKYIQREGIGGTWSLGKNRRHVLLSKSLIT